MHFTWDDRKSVANLRLRGFDFAFATLVFESPTLEREDRRAGYGERRVIAVGVVQGLHITVVYTDRAGRAADTVRRIISATRSNQGEREAWEAATARE